MPDPAGASVAVGRHGARAVVGGRWRGRRRLLHAHPKPEPVEPPPARPLLPRGRRRPRHAVAFRRPPRPRTLRRGRAHADGSAPRQAENPGAAGRAASPRDSAPPARGRPPRLRPEALAAAPEAAPPRLPRRLRTRGTGAPEVEPSSDEALLAPLAPPPATSGPPLHQAQVALRKRAARATRRCCRRSGPARACLQGAHPGVRVREPRLPVQPLRGPRGRGGGHGGCRGRASCSASVRALRGTLQKRKVAVGHPSPPDAPWKAPRHPRPERRLWARARAARRGLRGAGRRAVGGARAQRHRQEHAAERVLGAMPWTRGDHPAVGAGAQGVGGAGARPERGVGAADASSPPRASAGWSWC